MRYTPLVQVKGSLGVNVKYFLLLFVLLASSINASEISAGHDPTEPLSWLKPEPQQKKIVKKRQYFPSLQAINCNGSGNADCYAVLDDKSMKQGEKISGYTLLSINDDNVFIGRAGKRWELSLFSQDIKH